MMVSASTVRFIPNDTKAAPLLPDTPAKDISLRYDPGQATADLLTPAGAYSFAFQTFCLGCTPGVSPIDLATRPQLSAEYAEFMQSLTRFNSVYTRLNNIAALWRIGVTSKNQPSSADPPDAMGLYSELNHRFAAYCSEPARSCVQTYETYQACESAGPQAGCGQPPSCSAFCTLSQDAIRELKAGVCTARIMDSATLFPDWTPVAKKLDAARAAHGPIDPSQIKLTPAPPGPQRDFMGKPVDPDNPCSVEANFSTSILSKLTEIKAPPSPHTAGGAAAAPVMVDGKWQVAMTGNILTRTDPVYPPMAKAAHVQGLVVLMATISAGGSVEELNAVSGPPMLQQAAVEAVKNWTFRPYLIDGKPVEVRSKIAVNFAIGTGEPQAPPAAPPQ
jgi:TonB family protein